MRLVRIAGAGLVVAALFSFFLVVIYRQHTLLQSRRVLLDSLKKALYRSSANALVSLGTLSIQPASSTWPTDPVPRIIHQMAGPNASAWPVLWRACQSSWKSQFRDFQYHLWHDAEIYEFVRSTFPQFWPTFLAYPHNISRIDLARYLLLYEYGGIYADMDFYVLRNFYGELPAGRASIAESAWDEEVYQNALMASPPRHPYWHYLLSELLAQSARRPSDKFRGVISMTGPTIVNTVNRLVPSNMLHALSWEKFAPEKHVQSIDGLGAANPDAFTVHLGTCSWCETKVAQKMQALGKLSKR